MFNTPDPQVLRFETLGADPNWRFTTRVKTKAALVYVTRYDRKSVSRWQMNGRSEILICRHLLLVPPGMDLTGDGYGNFIYMEFPAALWRKMNSGFSQPEYPAVLHCNNFLCHELETRIMSLWVDVFKRPPGAGVMADSLAMNLLGLVFREILRPDGAPREYPFLPNNPGFFHEVNTAAQFLETHFREPFSLAGLAKKSGLNRSDFCRLFLILTWQTPVQYRLRCQLEHAVTRLIQTNDSVADIGADSGFEDTSYFIRCFKRNYQRSPAALRAWSRGH